MTLPIAKVLEIISGIDNAFALGGDALRYAKQQHPELANQDLPDAGADMDQAREEALRRAVAGGDVDTKGKPQP